MNTKAKPVEPKAQGSPVELVRKPPIAVCFLNRPEALNALSDAVIEELAVRLEELDRDESIGAIVLAGRGRAFAAGADIKGMVEATEEEMSKSDRLAKWLRVWKTKKPLIAAVHGFALGGGCELVMGCDLIVAAEDAEFGQPEILIGIMPGAGGTQRLTRAVGANRAMELVLTGRRFSAQEAHSWGLVNKVVPKELLLPETEALALEIAKRPRVAAMRAKEAVLKAGDVPLHEGLRFERQLFYSLFSTEDQKEGMRAFLQKREPKFKNK
ncbi:MAG: enoyl-CoA hydratase/isomerase family protein [Elusimicrobia bacterium]|nr:enoyl-CoA hydratase/isomerase family protein [Elusimicrobiota bacterium]